MAVPLGTLAVFSFYSCQNLPGNGSFPLPELSTLVHTIQATTDHRMNGVLVVGGPSTLKGVAETFEFSRAMRNAAQLFSRWLHSPKSACKERPQECSGRGGVRLPDGTLLRLDFVFVDDEGSTVQSQAATAHASLGLVLLSPPLTPP